MTVGVRSGLLIASATIITIVVTIVVMVSCRIFPAYKP